jgi:hypothetical protein
MGLAVIRMGRRSPTQEDLFAFTMDDGKDARRLRIRDCSNRDRRLATATSSCRLLPPKATASLVVKSERG